MRVERLPFTVYDVVGYFFPGLIAVIGLVFLAEAAGAIELINKIETAGTRLIVVAGLFLFVFAYALGHVISLIAALTIEKLVTTFVGYPSQYLIPNRDTDYSFPDERDVGSKIKAAIDAIRMKQGKSWSVKLVRFFIFPLYWSLLIVNRLGLMLHMVKRLEKQPKKIFDERFERAFGAGRDTLNGKEWFSLVESAIWCHSPGGAARMYNYLTIYGFCRNISLVSYFLSVVAIGIASWMIIQNGFSLFVNVKFLSLFIFIPFCGLFLSAILMFGFLKFYRRYSYEAIYNFIMMDNKILHDIGHLPTVQKSTVEELFGLIKAEIKQ